MSYVSSDHSLNWDIWLQFCLLSYILMGCKLRKWGKDHKNNCIASLLIIGGMMINVGLGYINYLRGLKWLPVDVSNISQNPFSYCSLAPIEVVASSLIFAGFSAMIVKRSFYRLSSYILLIYLIHPVIRDVCCRIVGERLFGNSNIESSLVVILSITIFLIFLTAAILYKRFERNMRS